jgi:hypothetical protein
LTITELVCLGYPNKSVVGKVRFFQKKLFPVEFSCFLWLGLFGDGAILVVTYRKFTRLD